MGRQSGISKQRMHELKQKIEALELVIERYEDAMRAVQRKLKFAEVAKRKSDKNLARLVHLMKHNVKNADTILKQLGESK